MVFAFLATGAVFPFCLLFALAVDVIRRRPHFSSVRMVIWLLLFLSIENLGLLRLAWVWLTTASNAEARKRKTYAVQHWYGNAHLACVISIFNLRIVTENPDVLCGEGPLVILVRHASLVDVLLPHRLISRPHGFRLRYVVKRELLWEPCLDIAGHWTPNHFVDRTGENTAEETAAVSALKGNLAQGEGVVLYPEGTRFSVRKREALLSRLRDEPRRRAEALRHLLPAHHGGVLGLLATPPVCNVVFIGHIGLDGLTQLKDIWRGHLAHRTVHVRFWKETAANIPLADDERRAWLDACWQRMDDWIEVTSRLAKG